MRNTLMTVPAIEPLVANRLFQIGQVSGGDLSGTQAVVFQGYYTTGVKMNGASGSWCRCRLRDRRIFERQFLAYLKPFNSELPHDHRDNYYAEREWRCDINVNFALSDVRAVIVHPDFAGRCAADFSELSDRLRP